MPQHSNEVIVTVSDDALDEINMVAQRLVLKGLRVKKILPLTGVISGSFAAEDKSPLTRVSGVLSVEEDLPMHQL